MPLNYLVLFDRDLAVDLERAIARAEMFAVYQPQVALDTGTIVAVEALCRWKHPERGLVPPAEFIPVAEDAGLIDHIGRFMLDECLTALDAWAGRARPVEISVNVSPAQLVTDDFAGYLREQVERRSLPQNALTVEVTESWPVSDMDAVVPRLNSLRSLGVGVAIDDFGTGHSSPYRLTRLPVTELKLDRSLIQRTGLPPKDGLAATVEGARERGVRIVAEGVETERQRLLARSLGCDRAQGYLFGFPVPRPALDALLGV